MVLSRVARRVRCGPGPGAARAVLAGARCAARASVEFALHPGGYVRLGEDGWLLVAVPRAPRGPLTLLVAGLEAAPLARATRPRSTSGRVCVSGALQHRRSNAQLPAPRRRTTLGARAAPRLACARWRAALAAVAAGAAPRSRPASPRCARGDDRRGRRWRSPAAATGSRPRATTSSPATPRWRHAPGAPVALADAARCSPLGLAYLRCAERGELPEPAARGAAGDPGRRRRRGAARRAGAVALGRELRSCDAVGDRGGRRRERDRPQLHRPAVSRRQRPGRADRWSRTRCCEHVPVAPRLPAHGVHRRRPRRRARARAARARGRRRDPRRRARRAAARRPRRGRLRRRPRRSTPATPASSPAPPPRAGATRSSTWSRAAIQHVNFIFAPAPLRDPRRRGRPAAPAEAARHGAAPCSTTTRTCRRWSSTSCRSTCASSPPPTRPTTTCSPAAAPGLDLGAPVDFLDAGPPEAADWTLLGCERSRQIHVALYGHDPHARVDFCPLLVEGEPGPEPTLLKCCLRERGIEREGARMTVPWGASLEEVRARCARWRASTA